MIRTVFSRYWQAAVIGIITIGVITLGLGGYLTPFSRILLSPLVKGQTWLYQRFRAVQDLLTVSDDVMLLRQRNAELEAENSRLQIQVIELQQQVAEGKVLSTLVDYARSRPESRYIAAAVIGFDTSPFLRYVIINRGSDDGLRPGMPVVTDKGLVGSITAVTAGAARVKLLTDATSAIDVHLQQTDADAVLVGQLSGDVNLDMIPQNVNVQPGDIIVTSGLGGNYPANLVIGQVSTVRRRDFDLFQTAAVQMAVDFRQLEVLLVIVNFQPVEIAPLIPAPEVP